MAWARVELGDGRKHAIGVGREEEHHRGGLARAGLNHALDVAERICGAAVLGDGAIGVDGSAALAVELHILRQAAEADGVVDVRFALAREVDGLGVAAALDVEDAAGAPNRARRRR